MLAHRGLLLGQSAQMAFSGFFSYLCRILICLWCCSFDCLLILPVLGEC